jgi:hypothetical protein
MHGHKKDLERPYLQSLLRVYGPGTPLLRQPLPLLLLLLLLLLLARLHYLLLLVLLLLGQAHLGIH